MIVSGKKIAQELGKTIIIDPFNSKQLNSNSYNLRLHDELLMYDQKLLDMKKPNTVKRFSIPQKGLVLNPGFLYLARTIEYTKTDCYVPMLEGRSSIGRLGLFIHITAGFGDVGFAGYWTLEMFCVYPIRVYAGVEICQIFYHTIDGPYSRYESNKYQNNTDVQQSMLYKDFRQEKDL